MNKAEAYDNNIKMAKQLKADYEDVFSTVRGQRVLKDILVSGVMFRSAFNVDPYVMAANCAKQDFARHINDMATPVPSKDDLPRKATRKTAKAAKR